MRRSASRIISTISKAAALLALLFVALPRLAAGVARRRGERRGYTMRQFKFAARDGTRLSGVIYVPLAPPPKESGYPAIVMVHSWMMSRWQNHLYAPYFASDGYVVLSYDCRGWGSSRGQVQCADPEYELCDLEDALDWLQDQSLAPVDPERIGITGISYGGGHSFLIAGRDPRIRAIVPMHGWTDLRESLVPHGSLKYIWGLSLLFTASWATKCDPRNRLYRWTLSLLLGLRDYDTALKDLDRRSALPSASKVDLPAFIVGSWHDDLFEPNQMLHYYQELRGPKKLYIGFYPHGMDAGLGPRLWGKELWSEAKQWFDRWLKDEGAPGEPDGPRVRVYQYWKKGTTAFEDWPPPGQETVTLYLHPGSADGLAGGLAEHEPGGGSAGYRLVNTYVGAATSGPSVLRPQPLGIPVPGPRRDRPGRHISFQAPPAQRDLEILGIPLLRLRLRPDSPDCQVNAFLYDAGDKGFPRLITYGTRTLTGLEPGAEREVDLELIACDWLLKRGHSLRLTLSASNALFVQPLWSRFSFEVLTGGDAPSTLLLPVMGGWR
jgi:predicted acyl esterase